MGQILCPEESSLKVHVHDGNVWYLNGDKFPECSNQDVASFIDSSVFQKASAVRVLGTKENCEFILSAYGKKVNGSLLSLQVASPVSCALSSRRKDPEKVLLDMRRWFVPPSCGGWHECGPLDFPSYAICFYMERGRPDTAAYFWRSHPAFPSVSFVLGINETYICKVIAEILDPRFFVDPDKPDRASRIEAYMGLRPDVQKDLPNLKSEYHKRCAAVLGCWKNEPPSEANLNEDRYFLWRSYYKYGGGWKGDLRTSQKFLFYLRCVWLDGLYDAKPWAEPLFVPEYFFNKSESGAYRVYLRSFANIK